MTPCCSSGGGAASGAQTPSVSPLPFAVTPSASCVTGGVDAPAAARDPASVPNTTTASSALGPVRTPALGLVLLQLQAPVFLLVLLPLVLLPFLLQHLLRCITYSCSAMKHVVLYATAPHAYLPLAEKQIALQRVLNAVAGQLRHLHAQAQGSTAVHRIIHGPLAGGGAHQCSCISQHSVCATPVLCYVTGGRGEEKPEATANDARRVARDELSTSGVLAQFPRHPPHPTSAAISSFCCAVALAPASVRLVRAISCSTRGLARGSTALTGAAGLGVKKLKKALHSTAARRWGRALARAEDRMTQRDDTRLPLTCRAGAPAACTRC